MRRKEERKRILWTCSDSQLPLVRLSSLLCHHSALFSPNLRLSRCETRPHSYGPQPEGIARPAAHLPAIGLHRWVRSDLPGNPARHEGACRHRGAYALSPMASTPLYHTLDQLAGPVVGQCRIILALTCCVCPAIEITEIVTSSGSTPLETLPHCFRSSCTPRLLGPLPPLQKVLAELLGPPSRLLETP